MSNTLHEDISIVPGVGADGDEPKVTVRLEPGMVIPGTRYRIERWLGEGGVGVVFECSHVDLKRRAALKVLKGSLTPRATTLFREEAIAAAKAQLRREGEPGQPMGSPHLIDVFDVGELPDGRLWIAMELLDGVSLSSQLKDDFRPVSMPVSRSVGILRQICKGLSVAHKAGVVHRDVKPANVMLVHGQGRDDLVKLVDFGVAATPDKVEENSKPVLVGTPPYMAPEQIAGEGFDHRLDIYALGCVAYRMMTGDLPFRGSTLHELFRAHQEQAPRLPSSVNPDIPTSFDPVILKCLEKDPSARFESMDALEAALCDAQLAAGVITPWDDLSLPDVDPKIQARLRALQPDPAPSSSRWLWPAIAAVAVVIAVAVIWWGRETQEEFAALAAASDSDVTRLVDAARKSAAGACWLYPDPTAPEEPTAYSHVLELEALDGEPAVEAAKMLRSEFAHALNRLGDRYWEHPDGKAFALDYYVQASIFEPSTSSPHVTMSPGERMLLSEKAARLEFTPEDLRATQPLIALAEPDEALRDQKLLEVLEDDEDRPETTSNKLQNLLRPSSKSRRKALASRRKAEAQAEPETEPDTKPETEPEADIVVEEPAGKSPSRGAEVAALIAEGRRALKVANRSKAERLFHRALAIDGGNAAALYGLGVVHFDRGDYGKATTTLSRAVAARPRDKAYQLKLGDAYFKNFQYDKAQTHYKKAADLGSKAAKSRLAKVDAKLR